MRNRSDLMASVLIVSGTTLGLFTAGCGANTYDLLIQYANAVATTALDQWLTDLANAFAGTPLVTNDSTDGEDDSTPGEGDGSNGDDSGPEGDPTVGEALYTTNSCGLCHCADVTGGCALAAPAIIGAGADEIAAILEATSSHPLKPELSGQEMADLAAFLASVVQ